MTLKHLFLDGLAELYDAEVRLVSAMPQLAAAATFSHLRQTTLAHIKETEGQVKNLEQVFQSLGERPRRKTSEVTIALLNESNEILAHFKGLPVLNAALIADVQNIEHYEIASYGCLRDWAALLGNKEEALVFQAILCENKTANRLLTERRVPAAITKHSEQAPKTHRFVISMGTPPRWLQHDARPS